MCLPESTYDSMTNEELLAEYLATREEAARQAVLLRYSYLIKMIAMQMRGLFQGFAEIEDVVNEGFITLMAALDRFDPAKNVKFESYASLRIRGTIVDMARKNDWLPRRVRKTAREIDDAETRLYNELGRAPTQQEIADSLGMDIERYRKALGETGLYNVVSLNEMLDLYGQDMAAPGGEENTPGVALQKKELNTLLQEAIATLRENEQLTLSLYYRKGLSMAEIAGVLGVTKPRVSQIHANALRKLRFALGAYITL